MQAIVDFVFNWHFLVGVAVGYFVVPYIRYLVVKPSVSIWQLSWRNTNA